MINIHAHAHAHTHRYIYDIYYGVAFSWPLEFGPSLGHILGPPLEPVTYQEAAEDIEWVTAMDSEIQSINKNRTWKLATLPPGHKPVSLKWVYKLKRNSEVRWLSRKQDWLPRGMCRNMV